MAGLLLSNKIKDMSFCGGWWST